MSKFAKLFGDERQILVRRQDNDDGNPEVRFYFDPEIEGLDVSSFAVGFPDSENGVKARDKFFESVDEKIAKSAVSEALKRIEELA